MLLHTLAVPFHISLVSSIPLTSELAVRAGGPVGKPIPADCSTPLIKPAQPADSFRPSPSFVTAYQVYSYFLPGGTKVSEDAGYRQCLEGCYGFGSPGQCESIAWAHNVAYTAAGSTHKNGTACMMFSQRLTFLNLQATNDGSFTGAKASLIDCP